jgi:hypothetical protein
VPPATVLQDYQRLRAADPSRPVLLNLSQGVAWDGWHGRGTCNRHPEDYPEYLRGCDIASFDIYPVNHDRVRWRASWSMSPAASSGSSDG